MRDKPDFLVIGAGVIGLSTALELKRKAPHASVLVIEKGELGEGCSYGNAGWLTPCFSMPLPMPGMLIKSIRWLLDPESPLYIRPVPTPLLLRWLTYFLFSMNERAATRSIKALTELSLLSLKKYEQWDQELKAAGGSPFKFEKKGLLMITSSPSGQAAAEDEMRRVAAHGVAGKKMSASQIRLMVPALLDSPDLFGGVFFPDEAHVEPMGVVQGLHQLCVKAGVDFSFNEEVWDFEFVAGNQAAGAMSAADRGVATQSNSAASNSPEKKSKAASKKITKVITTRRVIEPGQVILAAGSWSHRVGRALGLNIPMMGGKGYSMVLRHASGSTLHWKTPPLVPIMVLEKKIAITPRSDGTTRVAGTLELVNLDFTVNPRRVRAIFEGAKKTFGFDSAIERVELWRGLRPCTPDGVPLIGRVRGFANLVISTGHQMLGLQSAPGSGELTAALALGLTPPVDPQPFRPERLI